MRTSLKMLWKCAVLLCLAATALAEDLPGKLPSPSLPPPPRPHSSHRQARTQWAYHAADDSYRQPSEGVSHGQAAPPQGLTLRATEGHPDYPAYSPSDYWRSTPANLTASNAYGYSRPYSPSSPASLQRTPPMILYQTRPPQPLKKLYPNYLIPKPHSSDPKPKYKKTVLYQPPTTLKKPLHPRVHKPYAKHKYPTQKTIHPPYRRYYQSPYQKYAIPLTDILRHNPPPLTTDAHHTTERMDDAYPDASDDYTPYNDTHHHPYEDPDSTPDSDATYDDTTTRNYYGDRIYMSTQLPLTAPEDTPTPHRYFLLRRTSDDDDIETIFE